MEMGEGILISSGLTRPLCPRPAYLQRSEVPESDVDHERGIFRAQALESGKPENIVEKMVEGRMRKFLGEVTLLGQPFVKDTDITVQKLLDTAGAKVLQFCRLEVGEGIERKQESFAEEVRAQTLGR